MAHVLKANLSYITRLFLKMERRRGDGKEGRRGKRRKMKERKKS